MIEVIRERGALWRLTKKRVFCRLDKFKRREYWLACQCGVEQWVRWARLQQGKSLGCRSCRSHLRKHGKRYEKTYQMWHDLLKKSKRLGLVAGWANYEEFDAWVVRFGWQRGDKMVRIDSSKPWGPDNCDFVLIKKKKADDAVSLPVSVKQVHHVMRQ
jgi:hypothetical protein